MRTVCAYAFWFPRPAAAGEVWGAMHAWIAGWYGTDAAELTLPPVAEWERGGCALEAAAHRLECHHSVLADGGPPLRELRWQFPDAADDSLLWTIDATALAGDGAVFSLLLRVASASFELVPARITLRPPRVIRAILARGDVHVGAHRLQLEPIRVAAEDVGDLCMLIIEQSRRHPLIVISPEAYTDDRYAVDPGLLAERLAGLASVYVLDSRWSAQALTDELGKRYSCYNGATRIYWPRFDRDGDPFAHPLWLSAQIGELGGGEGLATILLRMIASAGAFRYVEPDPVRDFRTRAEAARIAKVRADSRPSGYDELFEEYVRLDTHVRELRSQLAATVEENGALRSELAMRWIPSLQDRATPRPPATDDRPEPQDVLAAVEAARRHADHLVFLPEALESARASPYRLPHRAYSALLAIEDVARRWAAQLAGGPNLGSRRDAFRVCGFDYKDDISQTAEGKWRDEYTYTYEGKRIVFAPHITIGAKSPDRCLSIHMHWHEAKRKVIIAHVGRHKTNTRS